MLIFNLADVLLIAIPLENKFVNFLLEVEFVLDGYFYQFLFLFLEFIDLQLQIYSVGLHVLKLMFEFHLLGQLLFEQSVFLFELVSCREDLYIFLFELVVDGHEIILGLVQLDDLDLHGLHLLPQILVFLLTIAHLLPQLPKRFEDHFIIFNVNFRSQRLP